MSELPQTNKGEYIMIWYGNAGHLCVSNYCRFHLCTEVGDYLVSTVGEYYPRDGDKMETIGAGPKDFYETMVFKLTGNRCQCGCGLPDVGGSDIDMDRYSTPKEANEGHMKYCRKYGRIKNDKAEQ